MNMILYDTCCYNKIACLDADNLSFGKQVSGSARRKLGITFELGNSLHTNKNPSAENIIKEAHSSINRLGYTGGLHSTDLVMVVMNINAKIRQHGYSSFELFTRYSAATGDDVVTSDSTIADKQVSTRLSSHNPCTPAHFSRFLSWRPRHGEEQER